MQKQLAVTVILKTHASEDLWGHFCSTNNDIDIKLDFKPEQRQLNELSFLSLNVCGLMQKLNCPEFITLIRTYDIIGLQEIKTDDYDTIDVTGYKVFLKNRSCTS